MLVRKGDGAWPASSSNVLPRPPDGVMSLGSVRSDASTDGGTAEETSRVEASRPEAEVSSGGRPRPSVEPCEMVGGPWVRQGSQARRAVSLSTASVAAHQSYAPGKPSLLPPLPD